MPAAGRHETRVRLTLPGVPLMADLGLRLRHRLQLALHNLVAPTGLDGLRPVRLRRDGAAFVLETTGHRMRVPSALIWRSYRRGWPARKARLAAEFGLGDPFPVAPGETVIDIGANVGDFALTAAEAGARVFAFDGDPVVVACLKANTADIPEVTADCAILWKQAGEVTFYSAPDRADSSLFRPPGAGVTAFTAQATTLDALAGRHGIGAVALLKMDAEGAEPEVLEGAAEVLARTRAVAIDTGPERNGEETGPACAAILRDRGFAILPNPNPKRKITLARRPD